MNPTQPCASDAPHLSPDFAERAIRKADRIVAGRRRTERAVALTAFVSMAVVVTISGFGLAPLRDAAHPATPPVHLAQAGNEMVGSNTGEDNDALTYLFPDAASVARFDNRDDQYADATDDTVTDGTQDSDDDGANP
jgi:hypothetical protein